MKIQPGDALPKPERPIRGVEGERAGGACPAVPASLARRLERSARRTIPAEAQIENIGYFTPSWHRLRVAAKEKRLRIVRDDFEGELTVRIAAHRDYGLPITADLDLYRAFQVILYEKWLATQAVPTYFSFSTNRILSLCGRDRGEEWGRVKIWRRRLQYTAVTFDGDFVALERIGFRPDDSWSIFAGSRGVEWEADARIEGSHMVRLSDWYREHLEAWEVRPVDLEGELSLRSPLAKALSCMLDFMFFAARRRGMTPPLRVRKRYDDLCADFLLRMHSAPSLIRQQLGRPHRELEALGKVAAWDLRPSKDGSGWVLEWEAGPRMEEIWAAWTHQARLRTKAPFLLGVSPVEDSRTASPGEAVLLVRMFQEKFNALKEYEPQAKEQGQALDLIRRHGFDTAARIVEHAMRSMRRTKFHAQWFGAVMRYEGAALAHMKAEEEARKRAAEAAKRRTEAEEMQATARAELEQRFDGLPPEERRPYDQRARDILARNRYMREAVRRGIMTEQQAIRVLAIEEFAGGNGGHGCGGTRVDEGSVRDLINPRRGLTNRPYAS